MTHVTHFVPHNAGHSNAEPAPARVSLPAPPWGAIDRCARNETAPRNPPIRANREWRDDSLLRWADRSAR